MKRLMVANLQKKSGSRYASEKFETILKAQIENMLEIGWKQKDIIFLSNFDFEFMGISAKVIKLNDFCLSGSKMWAMKWLFDHDQVDDVIFSSDLDCWQNVWFDEPEFSGDVGASQYSNPKFNGGSIFWKPSSKDIIEEIVKKLTQNSEVSEEPTLNLIFKSNQFKNRVTILNHTYNVGCSGFMPRFERSIKPIHVSHFHPSNSIAWEIHSLDREGIGSIAITIRLERLLRKHYPSLATELKVQPEILKEMRRQKKEQRRKEKEDEKNRETKKKN